MFALGLDTLLVGNTTYCNFPEGAKSITKVGDLLNINYETIIKLQPDLILMTKEGNRKAVYTKLNSLGYKIVVSNPHDFKSIKNEIISIASIFNKVGKAKIIINKLDSVYSFVKSFASLQKRRSIVFLVSIHPLYVATQKSYINELLK